MCIVKFKTFYMYIIREIFHLHFGKYKDVKELMEEALKDNLLLQPLNWRMLTDFTGEGYRFIIELPYERLADYEAELTREVSGEKWQRWYNKVKPLVRYSEREILKQVRS